MSMQITHQEARRFIQFDSDGALNSVQKAILESHLNLCPDCRQYANSIRTMELTLRPLLKRQWNQQPIPLSTVMLNSRVHSKISESLVLATRITVLGALFVSFMVSALQFSASSQEQPNLVFANGPAIPPISFTSTQRIAATTGMQTCTETVYVVQEHDSLASIALQFAANQEEIATRNDLTSEIVIEGAKLIVPVCGSTPTGTVNAMTTTYTPVTGQITSTPTSE